MTHPPIVPPATIPLASEDPGEDRKRGPYEITIVTHESSHVTASVTLPPVTSLKRAKEKAHEVLTHYGPGAHATVSRVKPDAPLSDAGEVKYRAHVDDERTVRAGPRP